jgi:NADH:ubiquinone oxidoreductase subunit C
VEKNLLIQNLNKLLKDKILEITPFGRSGLSTVWIEAKNLLEAATIIRQDPRYSLDWLENLSVAQIDQALVISYFLRSFTPPPDTQNTLEQSVAMILRLSVLPLNSKAKPSVSSVSSLWPMATPMEHEASELFGINFEVSKEEQPQSYPRLLPRGFEGFPLRKNYQFPKKILGDDDHA